MAEPNILNLDTLVVRQHQIKIDGTRYDLRNPGEFPILTARRFKSLGGRISEIEQVQPDQLTADLIAEFDQLTGEFCRYVIDGPAEVVNRLSSAQRMAVIVTFFRLLKTTAATPGAIHPAARRRRSKSH